MPLNIHSILALSDETAFSWFKNSTKQNDISGFEDLLQRVNGFYQVFLSKHDSRSIDTIESLRKEKNEYVDLIKNLKTDIKELKKSAISSGDLSYMTDDSLAWWQKASINADTDGVSLYDDKYPVMKMLSEEGKRELTEMTDTIAKVNVATGLSVIAAFLLGILCMIDEWYK